MLSSSLQELLLCFAVLHRGLTLTVAVTVSLATTYPMSSTSPTEHTVLGITPCPESRRLRLVFATWISRVSKNCPEGAWVSPSAEGTPTPPADPSQRAIPELLGLGHRQDPNAGTGNKGFLLVLLVISLITHVRYIPLTFPLFPTAVVSFTHPFILPWTKRDDEGFTFTWLKHSDCSDQQEGAIGIQN